METLEDKIKSEFESSIDQITDDPEEKQILRDKFWKKYLVLRQGQEEIADFKNKFMTTGVKPTTQELNGFVSTMQHCIGTPLGAILYEIPRYLKK